MLVVDFGRARFRFLRSCHGGRTSVLFHALVRINLVKVEGQKRDVYVLFPLPPLPSLVSGLVVYCGLAYRAARLLNHDNII